MDSFCVGKKVQVIGLTIASIALMSILITLFVFNYPTFAHKRVIDALVFRNNSESLERFRTTADLENLQLSFYVYHINNPQDVIDKGAPFNLTQLGPFVYSEYKEKKFIDNDQIQGKIKFNLTRHYAYNQALSYNNLDSKDVQITWLNIPLLVASQTLENDPRMSSFEKVLAFSFLNRLINTLEREKQQVFITDSVHNFILAGSESKIFELIPEPFKKNSPLVNNRFGILYGKNDVPYPHHLTVSAGFGKNQNFSDLNKYIELDGKSELNVWKPHSSCDRIGGTDGEFFSPFLKSEDQLEIMPLDICRKLTLKHDKNVTFFGIQTWQYVLDKDTLKAPNNSQNSCYCISSDESPECQLDGLIDLQNCNGQAGIFASGAHFWAGSKNLYRGFVGDGTQADQSKHEPTFLIEPSTGLALKVKVPLQFNIKLHSNNGLDIFKFFKNEQPIFLPFIWVEEKSEMTEEQSERLKKELLIFDTWLISMVLGGAIILIVSIIVAAVILCLKLRNTSRNYPTETDPLIRRN